MEIYAKISFISIFSVFSWFSNMILSDALILPVSRHQTQQVMTSQIRSHRIINTELHTYYILLLILQLKLIKNIASLTVFNTI